MPWASRPCLPQGAADAMAILYTMCTREGDHWSKATVLVISCPEVRQRLIAYCARPNHDNHGNAPSQNGSAQPNGGPPYTAAVMDACTALARRGVIKMGFDRKGSTNTEKKRDELGGPKHRRT